MSGSTDTRTVRPSLVGRTLFWILALGFTLATLLTMSALPPVVASHFDAAGAPNGWSSRSGYVTLLLAVGVGVPGGVIALVHGLTQRGPDLLNVPSRGYWRLPAHRDEAVRRVRAYMWWLGCLMTATALAVHCLVLQAQAVQPPHLSTRGIVVVLSSLLAAVAGWVAGWYWVLRPPAESRPS